MAGRPRIPDERRQEVMDLFNEGKYSRKQISELTGIASGSVSQIVKDNGGTFDRSAQLEKATKQHALERREKRGALADKALDEARNQLEKINQSYEMWQLDIKGNWQSVIVEAPPAKEVELLTRAFKQLAETSMKLAIFDAESATDNNISMLTRLDNQFQNMINVQVNNNYGDTSQDNNEPFVPEVIIGEVED